MNDNNRNYTEVTLSPEQLQNMPESSSPWFVQYAEGDAERETVVDEVITLIWTMVECVLTPRQKLIMHLYYREQCTQVGIAGILGISQATVNHHLIGKMKRGKAVGGAMQKIWKSIRKEAAKRGAADSRRAQLISALNDMLDGPATRRHAANLFKNLRGIAGPRS